MNDPLRTLVPTNEVSITFCDGETGRGSVVFIPVLFIPVYYSINYQLWTIVPKICPTPGNPERSIERHRLFWNSGHQGRHNRPLWIHPQIRSIHKKRTTPNPPSNPQLWKWTKGTSRRRTQTHSQRRRITTMAVTTSPPQIPAIKLNSTPIGLRRISLPLWVVIDSFRRPVAFSHWVLTHPAIATFYASFMYFSY